MNKSHDIKSNQPQYDPIKEEINQVEPEQGVPEEVKSQYFAADAEVERDHKDRKGVSEYLRKIVLEVSNTDYVKPDS